MGGLRPNWVVIAPGQTNVCMANQSASASRPHSKSIAFQSLAPSGLSRSQREPNGSNLAMSLAAALSPDSSASVASKTRRNPHTGRQPFLLILGQRSNCRHCQSLEFALGGNLVRMLNRVALQVEGVKCNESTRYWNRKGEKGKGGRPKSPDQNTNANAITCYFLTRFSP